MNDAILGVFKVPEWSQFLKTRYNHRFIQHYLYLCPYHTQLTLQLETSLKLQNINPVLARESV